MQLTQKEVSLLKDMRNQEKLCIDKYSKYAAEAHDPQLRQLFDSIAGTERAHLDMLNQIEAGQSPRTSTATDPAPAFQAFYPTSQTPEKQADSYLCADLLSTEKHVSALYNTCVFEFTQNDLRKVLNRIQTDEQYHGEQLWKYMSINSMYS